MAARFLRPKRVLTLALLAASVAVGIWWLGYVPYDSRAVFRPIPSSATVVGRHLELPKRWADLLENPLARAAMRTAGVAESDAADLAGDEESLEWFEKLAGREGTLAFLPGRFGGPSAWMAVSHLGGESQKLRWQLSAFKVPGFERMEQFPGRSVWRVHSPDLDPRQKLVIAFGEGVLMACLSENAFAIAEVLGAYDGTVERLVDGEPSFRRFAAADDRRIPDRLWLHDESDFAATEAPGVLVDVPTLRGNAISLAAATEGLDMVPPDRLQGIGLGALARWLGASPCAAALVRREALGAVLGQPWAGRDVQHALIMAQAAASDSMVVLFLDGDFGGRLAWGAMRSLGLAGLRVPTVVLATPVADAAAAAVSIQRILDASNARYRAAFVLRPVAESNGTIHVLESAGGNEWVDALARSDRPAYAVLDGWLVAASNMDALQKVMRGEAAGSGAADWAGALQSPDALSVWLDLQRAGKVARDGMATWSMAQMFLAGGSTDAIRERLNEAKAWIDSLAPFGQARARLGRRGGETVLSVDFGLSASGDSDRISAP